MQAEVFTNTPNQLKTIEVDVEKGIFRVNGQPFDFRCTGFSISYQPLDGYKVYMQVDTEVQFASYNEAGEKQVGHQHEVNGQSVAF